MTGTLDDELSPPPDAEALFGARLPLAFEYAKLLAGNGVAHGHLGPREVPRLWDRHLLNSAIVADLLPVGVTVLDVGSGAGLPGIPLAICRPDLSVVLLEPMLRRTRFLDEAVSLLGLADQVSVMRGRADDPAVREMVAPADWVLARAVAPLDRLVKWCLPLLSPRGRILAMKGSSASVEVSEHKAAVRAMGAHVEDVIELGAGLGSEPTWVVSITGGARRVRAGRPAKGRR